MQNNALDQRRAGIMLHPTSLPGSAGNGDIGPQAYHFVDFLQSAGASVWQMLPIGQTQDDRSPYQCTSVNAGNRWLISIDLLIEWGWLHKHIEHQQFSSSQKYRTAMLQQAWLEFQKRGSGEQHDQLGNFIEQEHYWIRDYALFSALKQEYRGLSWQNWPDAQSGRYSSALRHARQHLVSQIQQVYFEQFVFYKQWSALKEYANNKGILLFGDIPIFVSYDSADVWSHRRYFKMDEKGQLQVVAGVPPDYFSETGQRWGNPCYDWQALQSDNFKWWQQRLFHQLKLFDLVRIDHFRGFESFWEIPSSSETAIDGKWVPAKGEALFNCLLKKRPALPLVAEDLGLITDEVISLRDQFNFPGMSVFQFAFDGDPKNPHLPHNHVSNSVAYSGTHDNDTTLAWYQALPQGKKNHIMDYIGRSPDMMPWPIIRAVLSSVAKLAVIPMQDMLGLGDNHRMNQPGTTEGNWAWRFTWQQVDETIGSRFAHLAQLYNRSALDP